MPIEKPKKPTELVPRAFGGIKNNFSDDLQSTGFEPNIPQTYNGDNLNYHLDATGKELDYVEKVVDYITQMPVDSSLYVNPNNELDYINVGQFGNKADKDLANTGRITNCITEIPQRIKYTLENGTLTIKAGSVVIVPYGTEDLTSQYPKGATFLHNNFKVYDAQFADGKFFVWAELVNDVSANRTTTDSSARFLYLDVSDTGNLQAAMESASGTSAIEYYLYYNTANNLIDYYDKGIAGRGYVSSFPLGIVVADGVNVYASINQVFNGMGYIGSAIWCDKGVKILIPNGRNEDGTLKNTEYICPSLITASSTATQDYVIRLGAKDMLSQRQLRYSLTVKSLEDLYKLDVNTSYYVHVTDENLTYFTSDGKWEVATDVPIATATLTEGVVSNFQARQVFRAADDQDVVRKSGDTMTGNLIISRNTASIIECQNVNMDYTSTEKPSSNTYCGGITFYDKNHKSLGVFRNRINTGGIVQTQMSATRSVNGTDYTASVVVGVDANGDQLCTFPMCTTKATTTSSASTAKVAVVTQNYVNGTSWYRVWSDGWIEQGGMASITATGGANVTISLLKSFSNTNYTVSLSPKTNASAENNGAETGVKIKSASSFEACVSDHAYCAGCYWYACGY